MKKYLGVSVAGLLIAGLTTLIPAVGSAAVVATQVLTASATVGAGTVSMTVVLKDKNLHTDAQRITWTGVSPGSGWQAAEQYAEITASLQNNGSFIQTYQDNTNPAAVPQYTGFIGASSPTPAGLVDTTQTDTRIPLAWHIQDATGTVTADEPNTNVAWFYYEDTAQVANNENASDFNSAAAIDYRRVAKAGGLPMIHSAQGPAGYFAVPSPNFMYFGANFNTAVGGRSYASSTITVEAVQP